jgi:FtsZ-interacting cell division protein ZipA
MVNENIVTALQNSITKGEPLDQAKQVMINSGYDQNEVEEASHYIGGNITQNNQPKPDEQLTMPQHKRPTNNQPFQANFQNQQTPNNQMQQQNQLQPTIPTQANQQNNLSPQNQQLRQNQPTSQPQIYQPPQINQQSIEDNLSSKQTTNNLQADKTPEKKSYKIEIILVIILIFLLGILALTFLFRNSILSFLS